jgi:hypothetical protein
LLAQFRLREDVLKLDQVDDYRLILPHIQPTRRNEYRLNPFSINSARLSARCKDTKNWHLLKKMLEPNPIKECDWKKTELPEEFKEKYFVKHTLNWLSKTSHRWLEYTLWSRRYLRDKPPEYEYHLRRPEVLEPILVPCTYETNNILDPERDTQDARLKNKLPHRGLRNVVLRQIEGTANQHRYPDYGKGRLARQLRIADMREQLKEVETHDGSSGVPEDYYEEETTD